MKGGVTLVPAPGTNAGTPQKFSVGRGVVCRGTQTHTMLLKLYCSAYLVFMNVDACLM